MMQTATQRLELPVATITASAENPPNEGAARLNDGLSSTKWFASATTGWVVYQLSSAKVVTRYTLTSANDFANRDPKNWQFQGSNDGSSWTTLNTQTGQEFPSRFMLRTYTVSNTTAYSYYRLNITANNGNTTGMQLAEWNIYDEESYFGVENAANEAIEAPERRVVAEIRVDWNGNGLFNHPLSDIGPFCNDISVDRTLSGTAPAELMLIEGSAAAELSFTIGGTIPPDAYGLTETGQPMSWVSVFAPYNGNSPLYNAKRIGAEVKYRIGVETYFGTVWYPQFVGNIRTISPRRGSEAVTITALDRSELMRNPVNLPIWAVSGWHNIRGYREAQLMSSHWVIDQCVRSANISPTPYRPVTPREGRSILNDSDKWGLQLYVSGNGSHTPSVGLVNSAIVQGFPWSEGTGADMYEQRGRPHALVDEDVKVSGKKPFAFNDLQADATGVVPRLIAVSPATQDQDANRSHTLYYQCARLDDLREDRGGAHWLGFTLTTAGTTWWQSADVYPLEVFIGGQRTIRIHILTGSVRCELWSWTANGVGTALWGGEWVGIPTGLNTVQIDCQVEGAFASDLRLGTMVNGVMSAYNIAADASGTFPEEDLRMGIVKVKHQVGMSDIYWANQFVGLGSMLSTHFDQWRRPAKYAAVLDEGLNKLTFTPTLGYEDGWQLATSVAAAEMGAVFWDETGIFRFWNRQTMLDKQEEPVRTLTLDDVSDLGMTDSSDSVRTVITTDTSETVALDGVVFESTDPEAFYLAPGVAAETTITLASTDTQIVYLGKVDRYATTGDTNVPRTWNDNTTLHGYIVEFNTSGNVWQERNDFVSGVDLFAYGDNQGNINLRFYNGYEYPARLSKLRLRGTRIEKAPATQTQFEDATAIAEYGERNWLLQGDWVQHQPTSIQRLGDFMLARSTQSIPATDNIQIAGDPRLQVGDTLKIVDPDGFGETMLIQVLGIRRVLNGTDGLVDELTVELIRTSNVGIWDSPQYGRWDQTLIWS
jgi:hypothetical protein